MLQALTDAIRDSSVEVIDLTAPLSSETPIIQLPEPFGNTATFALQEISRYDDRGPAWYWNDISTGEICAAASAGGTGTSFQPSGLIRVFSHRRVTYRPTRCSTARWTHRIDCVPR